MPRLTRKITGYKHKANSDQDRFDRILTVKPTSSVDKFVRVRVVWKLPNFKVANSPIEVHQFSDNKLLLSKRDSKYFISVMKNPPEPSEGLLSLFD
ncbi:hypothetical protein ACE1AT_04370 [Pelatocladus sp. BLCC-F211]